MKATGKLFCLAAGGTGGHLFPAQALAEELLRNGHAVSLVTDDRARGIGNVFPVNSVHVIHSASLAFNQPLALPRQLWKLASGYFASRALLAHARPAAVVGFGGYPSLPPVLAAVHLGIPTVIHEQNAVLGRANRFLATRTAALATSFAHVAGIPAGARSKVQLSGNPVREIVRIASRRPYQPPGVGGRIRILVFGGSQGARFFSDMVPRALELLPLKVRSRLHVSQQCRREDVEEVRSLYQSAGIETVVSSFFADLPNLMAQSHLIVCRAGASTIAELGVIGRPAVLVPLPGAIDNDQLANARSFTGGGAGVVVEQKDAEINAFCTLLQELLLYPKRLKEAAAAAQLHGRPDAAQRLAALVESVAAL